MTKTILLAVLLTLCWIFIIEHTKDDCVETATHKCKPTSVNEDY